MGDRVAVQPNYSCGRCPLCRRGQLEPLPRRAPRWGSTSTAASPSRRACPPGCAGRRPPTCPRTSSSSPSRSRWSSAPSIAARPGRGRPRRCWGRGRSASSPSRCCARAGCPCSRWAAPRGASTWRGRSAPPPRPPPRAAGTREAARAFSGREGVDLVIETAGTPEAVEHAMDLARPGGRVVLTGLPHEPSRLSFFSVVRRELSIVGSMIYQGEFPEAIRLLAAGAVRPSACSPTASRWTASRTPSPRTAPRSPSRSPCSREPARDARGYVGGQDGDRHRIDQGHRSRDRARVRARGRPRRRQLAQRRGVRGDRARARAAGPSRCPPT